MSTQINQIIEVFKDGEWKYVPVAANVTQDTNCLQKFGSVRDIFACRWYDADKYIHNGVPEDISKLAREAMIYDDQDFITSGACWISAIQLEALIESLREKFTNEIDKLCEAKMKTDITERLVRIEDYLRHPNVQKDAIETCEDLENDVDYVQEELEEAMWAWVCLESNWSEIKAHVDYFTSGEYQFGDIRVIMFVS